MKRLFLCLLLGAFTLWLAAVPALRLRRTVTLDNGQRITVTTFGDEDFDCLLTDEGKVVLEQNGTYHLTDLTPAEYLATLPPMPRSARKNVGSLSSALVKPYGVKKIPVILTAFKDKKFTTASTDARVKAFYNEYFNGENIEPTTGNYGSVRQYFIDQSQGQFTPEFTVIGPVELDSVYGYYGGDKGSSKDTLYSKFVSESFKKAVAMEENWTQFDNDGNGKVDMCVIIFAGLGQNYTNSYGDKSTIWPKELPTSYTIDGVTLSGCSSSCEMHPIAANDSVITDWQTDGIGVVVHEISHAIGLPDLYDTNNVAFGMDYWSIMDYGMYTRRSKYPVGYTAYERDFMKWQQVEVIDSACTLHLYPFSRNGKGYKLVNDANSNEYYILDNRQAEGWDWGACSNRGHGMLVMHVDYTSGSWTSNKVNTTANHQRFTIIPANNSLIGSNNCHGNVDIWRTSLQGNPYPGITENHELTDESTPASLVYAGGHMGKPLVDIEETAGGIITVKVMPLGTLEPPTELAYQYLKPDSTTVIWQPAENAELYNLQLWSEGELVFHKDSIAGTSYEFADLRQGVDYVFSVQAISDAYRNSEWAVSESFHANPDAISDISESRELVRIYDTNGRFACECFADELHRFSLRRGIYIIRYRNGRIKKMII